MEWRAKFRASQQVEDYFKNGAGNPRFGYGSKLGTPKLWMVNTKLD